MTRAQTTTTRASVGERRFADRAALLPKAVTKGMQMGKARAKRTERTTVRMIRLLGERLSAIGGDEGERWRDTMDAMWPFDVSTRESAVDATSSTKRGRRAS